MEKHFRNYLGHKFNFHADFNLIAYSNYLSSLASIGANEIEHPARRLSSNRNDKARAAIDLIHDSGCHAVLYTGIFGTEDLKHNHHFARYAQRDRDGKALSYPPNNPRSSMMCPVSGYVEEIVIPETLDALSFGFDKVFLDIPWMMKGGCYCSKCREPEISILSNEEKIAGEIRGFVGSVKRAFPNVEVSINLGAPGIYVPKETTPSIKDVDFSIDEYVTEWNPLRVGQKPQIVERCAASVRELSNKKMYHATTCTDRKGVPFEEDLLAKLFYSIYASGATPRLGLGFGRDGLDIINRALRKATCGL